MAYQSINPFSGKILESFPSHDDEQVESAIEGASRCFENTWRDQSYAQRASVLGRAASILRERPEEFARLITLEMGKRISESRSEVKLSADIIVYYARNASRFLAPQPLATMIGEAQIENSPLGVLFGVEPWNYPYYQLARFVAPNLMAGNVVLLKHASSVPQCAVAFEKLIAEAGAPAGVYTNLRLSTEQVGRVVEDPRVKGVAFTGSAEGGAFVAAHAGRSLKKTTMELGGSDAFLVLEDAKLDRTVEWAVRAKMNNMGQSRFAAKRLVVVDAVADRFLERFRAALEALVPGDPFDEATTLAPLSSAEALDRLEEQVQRCVAGGARLVLGGQRLDRPGAFMAPTILTDVTPDNPCYAEEFFGPVALFFAVPDEDAAVALANDSPYGLGGCVFTADVERGRRVASRVETGMMFVNHPTSSAPELPFGGIKNSGYGRELSSLGIHEFVNRKLVRVAPIDAPA